MAKRHVQQIFVRIVFGLFWVLVVLAVLSLSHFSFIGSSEKSISIFTWPVLIDRSVIEQFEKETGIKVYVSYYDSNEELFSKLKATRGIGYDLVIPSDYMVPLLIKEGLVKRIEKNKIAVFDQIDPKLMGRYFDPVNDYTLPYFWAVYGLGIDKRYFKDKPLPDSWSSIFDPLVAPARIGMVDGPRESVLIAAQYLFGSVDHLDDKDRLEKIKQLLLQQKSRVVAYTESGVEYLLLSGGVPVVVTSAMELTRLSRIADFVQFVLPKEGGFALIDSFALPSQTKKDELVYQFINFLYRPEVISYHRNIFGMCPPLKGAQQDLEGDIYCPTDQEFMKMNFFNAAIPEHLFNDLWLTLMAM